MDSSTQSVLMTFFVGSAVLVASLLLFSGYLRKRFPDIYATRAAVNFPRIEDSDMSFWGWVRTCLKVDEAEVFDSYGLDATMFLRFYRRNATLFCVFSAYALIFLIPCYYSAASAIPSDISSFHGINSLSLPSITSKPRLDAYYSGFISPRMALHIALLSQLIFVLMELLFLYRDYEMLSKYVSKYRSMSYPSSFAVLAQDIPYHACTEARVRAHFEKIFPSDILSVVMVMDANHIQAKKVELESSYLKYLQSLEKLDSKNAQQAAIKCTRLIQDIEKLQHQIQFNPDNSTNTQASFIIFSTKRAAAFCVGTCLWQDPIYWTMSRAPHPISVNWKTVGVHNRFIVLQNVGVFVGLILFLIYWTIPLTFVTSLANISTLEKITKWKWIIDVRNMNPKSVALIEGLIPSMILGLFSASVPVVIKYFLLTQRIASITMVKVGVQNFYFGFLITSSFFFLSVSTSLITILQRLAEKPQSITSILAQSIPHQSTFYMNYVLMTVFLYNSVNILALPRLFYYLYTKVSVKRGIDLLRGIGLTERIPASLYFFESAIYFETEAAGAMLMAFLGIVFCVIAPLMLPCVALYFVISLVINKNSVLFRRVDSSEGTGKYYSGCLTGKIVGLCVLQALMIGFYAARDYKTGTLISTGLLISVLSFWSLTKNRFHKIITYGALEQIIGASPMDQSEETRMMLEEVYPVELDKVYMHPGLKPLHLELYKHLEGKLQMT